MGVAGCAGRGVVAACVCCGMCEWEGGLWGFDVGWDRFWGFGAIYLGRARAYSACRLLLRLLLAIFGHTWLGGSVSNARTGCNLGPHESEHNEL